MRGRLRAAVLTMFVCLAGAAPGAEAAPPALAGRTVVRVAGAAKMVVRVPHPMRLLYDTSQSVRVEGGGRFAGLVLREHHETAEELSLLRLPPALGGGVRGEGPTVPGRRCVRPYGAIGPEECTYPKPLYFDLRRGTYTLYAFSDGPPVTFTLRFERPVGAVTLKPSTRLRYGSLDLDTADQTPNSWAAGTSTEVSGRTDAYLVGWWTQDASTFSERYACWYHDTEGLGAAGQYRWVPHCPGGWDGDEDTSHIEVTPPSHTEPGPGAAGRQSLLAADYDLEGGTYGMGLWVSGRNIREPGGFAYWVGR